MTKIDRGVGVGAVVIPAAEAAEAEPAVEAAQPQAEVAEGFEFPRRGWADPVALGAAIDQTRQTLAELYRLQFLSQEGSSAQPPIQMRYGLPVADPVVPEMPPIAMRYGLPAPAPTDSANNPEPLPPIAMRYGLPAPFVPPQPPIAMRYGLPAPAEPPEPPIAMRYGLPAPVEEAVVIGARPPPPEGV